MTEILIVLLTYVAMIPLPEIFRFAIVNVIIKFEVVQFFLKISVSIG